VGFTIDMSGEKRLEFNLDQYFRRTARFMIGNESDIPVLFLVFTVGLSLFSSMMFVAVLGAFAPLLLNWAKVDPGVVSGPFVAASNDIIALLIYYGIIVSLTYFMDFNHWLLNDYTSNSNIAGD
jgi:hypothetical protein